MGSMTLDDQCDRLQRDANALGVMVLGDDGGILGHAGAIAALPDPVVEASADLVASLLQAVARNELQEGDDMVAEVDELQACAAPLGPKAVVVVVFDDTSTLSLVRLRMRRARDLLLRSLSEST
jgi:hypothetical protein